MGESRTWTSADRTEAAAELGDAFTDETSGLNTVRYELKVSGLSSYTFPPAEKSAALRRLEGRV